MKKIVEPKKTPAVPRFKQGAGVASWKLAAALIIGLLLGIGGGIAKSNVKVHQALSDYELGLDVQTPAADSEG